MADGVDAMDTSPSPGDEVQNADMKDVTTALPRVHSFKVNTIIFTVDSKYSPQKGVGKGAYGVVCSAEDTSNNTKVAIKKCQKVFDDLIDAKRILREIKLLQHFDHDNIVKLVDLSPSAPYTAPFEDIYMMLDLMETDLRRIINAKEITLSDDHIRAFTYQTLRGLKYIHSANVLHRDIKPSNLLVNSNCDLKICDFGLSRGFSHDVDLTKYVVTRWYRAPEIICSCKKYDAKVDVWATGCILAEMMGRRPLFPGRDTAGQVDLIFSILGTPSYDDLKFIQNEKARKYITSMSIVPRVQFSTKYPHANTLALDLLEKMLKFNPNKRISVDEALAHPYFDGFRNPAFEMECKDNFNFEFEDLLQPNTPKNELRARLQQMMWDECIKFMPGLASIEKTFTSQRRRYPTPHQNPHNQQARGQSSEGPDDQKG